MFSFNVFSEQLRPFNTMYKCYSVSMMPGSERENVDRGGRIFLPPSALDQLTRLNIVYPMLFKLTNPQQERVTHCGVLEFVADEGKCYMPYWMMRNLLLDEGSMVNIESVSLPVATFSKFQPQSVEFLDITNPKAVLENELRSFACLTTSDVIAISYNDRVYELCVLETKPGPAVSIIECDMNVDFAPPVGYVDPAPEQRFTTQLPKQKDPSSSTAQNSAALSLPTGSVFSGSGHILGGSPRSSNSTQNSGNSNNFASKSRGYRLDGKVVPRENSDDKNDVEMKNSSPPKSDPNVKRGIPDYDFKPGIIKFFR